MSPCNGPSRGSIQMRDRDFRKSRVGLTLDKAEYYVNLDPSGAHYFNSTYSPITLVNISPINLVFNFRCSSSSSNTVYVRRVDFSDLVFSLSSHRHSHRSYLYLSLYRFIINKQYTDPTLGAMILVVGLGGYSVNL